MGRQQGHYKQGYFNFLQAVKPWGKIKAGKASSRSLPTYINQKRE